MTKQLAYNPQDHPVTLALIALAKAIKLNCDPFSCLDATGLPPNSQAFDEAAELLGSPYCRELDLYVDRPTLLKAEQLGRIPGSSTSRVLLVIP